MAKPIAAAELLSEELNASMGLVVVLVLEPLGGIMVRSENQSVTPAETVERIGSSRYTAVFQKEVDR